MSGYFVKMGDKFDELVNKKEKLPSHQEIRGQGD